jgi:hypothetical protein
MRAVAKWLPAAFICVILVLLCFGVADIRALAAKSPADATPTAAELKDPIDELKWVLGLILAATGLFTIAQGIAAGFSAKSFSDQAERMLAEIKDLFPVFQLMQDYREEANENLPNLDQAFTQISPAQSLGGRAYGNLSLKLRQQILSAERTLPYEFVERDKQPDLFARSLRRLAQFYSAKFSYERERGMGSLGDIEHAQYLLTLAIRKAGSKFYLLNDLGNVHVVFFRVLRPLSGPRSDSRLSEMRDTLDSARSCFEDSITIQRQQLRAYYNLAVIEADLAPELAPKETPDKGLNLAIDHLREGLKYREWEQTQNDEFTCNGLYNLACYCARLSKYCKSTGQTAAAVLHENEAVAALCEAAKLGFVDPGYVYTDYTMDGDFFELLEHGQADTILTLKKVQRELSHHYQMAERQ